MTIGAKATAGKVTTILAAQGEADHGAARCRAMRPYATSWSILRQAIAMCGRRRARRHIRLTSRPDCGGLCATRCAALCYLDRRFTSTGKAHSRRASARSQSDGSPWRLGSAVAVTPGALDRPPLAIPAPPLPPLALDVHAPHRLALRIDIDRDRRRQDRKNSRPGVGGLSIMELASVEIGHDFICRKSLGFGRRIAVSNQIRLDRHFLTGRRFLLCGKV